ncbi:MAG: class I SAM-dependent methyltransferase [Taibaiella sp.]|nr:class I SAM-dependent methyltransferase [Taibaiella sp.]
MEDKILDSVNKYYSDKIKEHGISPKGVDWNSVESQELRFKELSSFINFGNQFSILDFGCGYGALLPYINGLTGNFSYTGFDISEEMIREARANNTQNKNAAWTTQLSDIEQFDYSVASGIFNVRLEVGDNEWKKYIENTLVRINKHSTKGFSFNMLTSYSDKEYMRDYLYYADPAYFFDFCKRNFSKYIALMHDYPLYEFTIIVKK